MDERIILKWDFRNRNGEQGLDFGGSGVGPAFASCESGKENLGSIRSGRFLD